MRTATELNAAEQRGQHIERYGHHAIYGTHDCPACQMHWRCRKSICKRDQESLCKDCESKTLVADVQTVGAGLHELLYAPLTAIEIIDALMSLMKAYGASDGRNGNSGECWDKARAVMGKVPEMKLYEEKKQELRLQVDGLVQQARLVQELEP